MVNVCNSSTWEVAAEKHGLHNHVWLHGVMSSKPAWLPKALTKKITIIKISKIIL